MPGTEEIQIRDPFIVPLPEQRIYLMFGTTGNAWGLGEGFDCYRSADLAEWDGPHRAFDPPAGFWADHNFWAPEVHRFGDRWYLFGSFKAEGLCRGTQILVADQPDGPYVPFTDGPVTPRDRECLDGTLHVEADGVPWMVFCHEWLQVGDGGMCALPLAPDLSAPAGDPVLLFHASEAPWAPRNPEGHYVTDGPFLHRAGNGRLLMLWSSFGEGHTYAVAVASSESGTVIGPWRHEPDPLYADDGGHPMLFRTFDDRLVMSLHRTNRTPDERPLFLPVAEQDGKLVLAEE